MAEFFPPFFKTRKGLLILFAVWSLPMLIDTLLSHARMSHLNQPTSLGIWLIDSMAEWYSWALFTPFIFWLINRFPINKERWFVHSLVLFVCGALIVACHGVLKVTSSMWIFNEPMSLETMSDQFWAYISWSSPPSLLLYAGIAAGATAFNSQEQLRKNQLKASQLETQFTRAQLDTLQRQLEPHFLFNTLNSISVLTQKGDIKQANQTLNDLSDLLRYVLQHQNTQKVPLHDELELVRRYVDIEQVRFGDRLHVTIDVPSDLLLFPVPSFILQLLVENAIKHGVAQKVGDGHVQIHARRDNGYLFFRIEDDGIGLHQNETDAHNGVGIANARKRLALLYQDHCRFELRPAPQGGAIAELQIPVEEKPNE